MFSVWQLLKITNSSLQVLQIRQSFFGHLNLNLLENTSKDKIYVLIIISKSWDLLKNKIKMVQNKIFYFITKAPYNISNKALHIDLLMKTMPEMLYVFTLGNSTHSLVSQKI